MHMLTKTSLSLHILMVSKLVGEQLNESNSGSENQNILGIMRKD